MDRNPLAFHPKIGKGKVVSDNLCFATEINNTLKQFLLFELKGESERRHNKGNLYCIIITIL